MKAKFYYTNERCELCSNLTFIKQSISKSVFTLILVLSTLLFTSTVRAQTQETETETEVEVEVEDDDYKMFSAGAHLKNMHIWHGFVVHQGAMFATNFEFNTPDKKFTFGFWGGGSFTSNDVYNQTADEYVSAAYKEFSIYSKYRFTDKFFIEAVTHNNYTGVQERGDELHYWRYDKTQGHNFVDVNFGYNVTPNTLLYLATIIAGRSGDYEVQADGSFKDNWTQYFEIKSKVWENEDYNLSLFAGGAWSLFTDKTFYTEGKGNVINVGMALGREINIGKFSMPVEVTAMWNPEKEITVLSLDFGIF